MVSMTTQPNSHERPIRKADDNTYNGFKNWETWNVALWIDNDAGLNHLAKGHTSYAGFIKYLRDLSEEINGDAYSENFKTHPIYIETPDHVAWNDSGLDYERLNELIKDMSEVLDNEM